MRGLYTLHTNAAAVAHTQTRLQHCLRGSHSLSSSSSRSRTYGDMVPLPRLPLKLKLGKAGKALSLRLGDRLVVEAHATGKHLKKAKRTKFLRSNSIGRRSGPLAAPANDEGSNVSYAPFFDQNVSTYEQAGRARMLEQLARNNDLHPVLDIVKRRFNRRFSEDVKKDGFKLGLVVEGGGMRGITSAGMLVEMHKKGMNTIFDGVYGSSAGAINLTYFLAEDLRGADIYHKHIANKDFISLSRLWRGKGEKPVLDVSYLLDHVMERVLPLQWDKVLNSSTPLKVAASSIDDGGNPILLEDFRDKDDLVECLRASASVPGIAQGPIHHRGHTLVDALLYEPIPIWSAIDDGCTHILVLSTKPKLEGQKIMNRLSTTFVRNFFMTPKYLDKKLYIESDTSARGAKTTEGLLAIDDPIESLKVFGANVYTVFPDSQPVGSLCKKVDKLQEARKEGHTAVQELYDNYIKQDAGVFGGLY
eukprot:CAMPEP_0197476282 /NCGR_PEP_ID=MMETSP1309-20131121/7593_1 /TAXON_ID=464262 /ORGANISM="Genus nov. species nov., Strain RCC998" /LENGTH=474 /DNA_ID=CAMNT_0043016501 /DNA_START=240 /DNA_END=1664 /DNA_ORIENTATION=-